MTHIDFRNRVLLGVCAVAATLAFAPAGSAHGAGGAGMGMGARGGGMAMQPPVAGPHPMDPSGHLGGPVNPAPASPRMQPTPSAPRLDPPGGGMISGDVAPRSHAPFNNPNTTGAETSGDMGPRSHAPFNNPNTTGGKLSGDVSDDAGVSPSAPRLDPPPK